MANTHPITVGDCRKLRIETHTYEDFRWYTIFADDMTLMTVHGTIRNALPFIAVDAPSRLIIANKENSHA